MKVLKFGGTSVGTAESIRNVKNIIASQRGRKIVVVSAMSGITNNLVELGKLLKTHNSQAVQSQLQVIKEKHLDLIENLFSGSEAGRSTVKLFDVLFAQLEEVLSEEKETISEASIVTFGETFLSFIFSRFLEIEGLANTLL